MFDQIFAKMINYNIEGRIQKVGNQTAFVEGREHLNFNQAKSGILAHEVVILERLQTCTDETRRAFLSQSKALVLKVSFLATFIGKYIHPGTFLIGSKLGERLVTLNIQIHWRNCSKWSEHFFKSLSRSSTLRNLAVSARKTKNLWFRGMKSIRKLGLTCVLYGQIGQRGQSITSQEVDANYYAFSQLLMQSEKLGDVWLKFESPFQYVPSKTRTKLLLAALEKKSINCHSLSPCYVDTTLAKTAAVLPLDFWKEVLQLGKRVLFYRCLNFDAFLDFR